MCAMVLTVKERWSNVHRYENDKSLTATRVG